MSLIHLMRLPRCARNDTRMRLPRFARNDTETIVIANRVKRSHKSEVSFKGILELVMR
jgi:hypothetical protein